MPPFRPSFVVAARRWSLALMALSLGFLAASDGAMFSGSAEARAPAQAPQTAMQVPPDIRKPSADEMASMMRAMKAIQTAAYSFHIDEIPPLMDQMLLIMARTYGPEHPGTNEMRLFAGSLRLELGDLASADRMTADALARIEKRVGPDSVILVNPLCQRGDILHKVVRHAEAEAHLRRAIAIAAPLGKKTRVDIKDCYERLGATLLSEERLTEAEKWIRLSIDAPQGVKLTSDQRRRREFLLARLLVVQGRLPEAKKLLLKNQKSWGRPTDPAGLFYLSMTLERLSVVAAGEGKYVEAEQYSREGLRNLNSIPADVRHFVAPATASLTASLAGDLAYQRRWAESDVEYKNALGISEKYYGPKSGYTASMTMSYGEMLIRAGRPGEAVVRLDRACEVLRGLPPRRVERTSPKVGRVQARRISSLSLNAYDPARCDELLAEGLWAWSEMGGGKAPSDRPLVLRDRAFQAAQRANESGAGQALSQAGARAAASAAGSEAGKAAAQLDLAIERRSFIEEQQAGHAGRKDAGAALTRQQLARDWTVAQKAAQAAEATLTAKFPRYWELRSPKPLPLSRLQVKSGADASLLKPGEVALLFLVPEGGEKGLVFAVSKTGLAWASLSLTGDELRTRVAELRKGLDQGSTQSTPFDRQASFELYTAVLGDKAIESAIAGAKRLIIVPSGPLTSLPPGVLVTQAPTGADSDPAALRATSWLLRSKSIAVLPALNSLQTLRSGRSGAAQKTKRPLLSFADPNFGSSAAGSKWASRSIDSFYDDERTRTDQLRTLKPLPGTLLEAQGLASIMKVGADSIFSGSEASEATIRRLNQSGQLGQARILHFATHGLIVGNLAGQAEPALALALPSAGATDDGLLAVHEIVSLKLDADWVILSACNTAAQDEADNRGLAGLARAIFHAGGRSILVSHWRIDDAAAAQLVIDVVKANAGKAPVARADALRTASLAMLDGPTRSSWAQPRYWAPFVLVGTGD
ncbi:MAG: CHAT domain-containing protein [Alphaproteobacteria bacterium]|nr:MAG: CHAT domain-containing protein [Alphaproteobacteria bacterium]